METPVRSPGANGIQTNRLEKNGSSYALLEAILLDEGYLGSEQGHSRLVKFLKSNKISLVRLKEHIDNHLLNGFFQSELFLDELHRERLRFDMWKRDFLEVKALWDRGGIDYVFIKSDGTFPHVSDNIDLLVKVSDFNKAAAVLEETGYIDLRNIQEAHKKFFRKFQSGESRAPIHLHERVCWGVPYEDNGHLWNHYSVNPEDPDIHHPSCEDTVLINLAHAFLEDHVIKLHDLLIVYSSVAGADLDWPYIVDTAENMHWKQALNTGILIFDFMFQKQFGRKLFPSDIVQTAQGDIEKAGWIQNKLEKRIFPAASGAPLVIPHLWTRRHTGLRTLRDPGFGSLFSRFRQEASQLFDGLIHLKLRMKTQPSMLISMSGLDGAGKTRHCEALESAFKTCDIRTKVVWSRSGSLPLAQGMLKVRNLLSRNGSDPGEAPKQSTGMSNLANRTKLMFWRAVNVADLLFFYFRRFVLPRVSGRVVIADRYIPDALIDLEYMGGSVDFNRPAYRILKRLAPRSEVMFFLDADPEAILRRGVDETSEELVEKRGAYQDLMQAAGAVRIDNTGKFDAVSSRIAQLALSRYFEKYPEKYDRYRVVSFRYK